ncbi:MAG: restriction endonuclease subunit S [Sphaerochaetaceae bacterium]|nr:restriction endonuclease subunit S [Sphaerochaetaceae bacterium]
MKITDLFKIEVAKSHGSDDYDKGAVPFITNSELNNGVAKYVDPFLSDKKFEKNTICISGLGFATLQVSEYLPKGNGGDSATILIPKNSEMSINELVFYTAQFNLLHKWRFSFGRKCSKKRIETLKFDKAYEDFPIKDDLVSRVKNVFSERITATNL